ncbi:hypothetical protein EIN_018740 [Entamoeba invadens IP1]|uniref:hypothetical protein n=1 Tax=Entamoeba invadens IP1 TaxID=370355 RepID=UPI0002C3E0BE|nr:hypothetical protein EIN_018740 [Entamoeba invadens IP1]ELP90515.1 hypothetical protein EIN_018740 [Entamoeba invadens IP1]|eukprot:XP_004257286.1 hypothetical protein EIN_018740 [Entamoeba invadens IP1]
MDIEELFVKKTGYKTLIEKAMTEGVGERCRALAWLVFMKILPKQISTRWGVLLNKKVSEYKRLREVHWESITEKERHIIRGDPLIEKESEVYKKQENVKYLIELDINRLYMDTPFFDESVKQTIERICYIFAMEHETLSYQQGQNELVGTLYFVFYKSFTMLQSEVGTLQKDIQEIMKVFCIHENIEVFVYALFDKLGEMMSDVYQLRTSDIKDEVLPIQLKCERIIETISFYDKQLADVLQETELLNVISYRFYKVLFLRDLDYDQVPPLWDAIFAYGNHLELANGIFIAILHKTRDNLLPTDDLPSALREVTPLPHFEDIYELIRIAENILLGVFPKINCFDDDIIHNELTKTNKKNRHQFTQKEKKTTQSVDFVFAPISPSTLKAIKTKQTPFWVAPSSFCELQAHTKHIKSVVNKLILSLQTENKKCVVDTVAVKICLSALEETLTPVD